MKTPFCPLCHKKMVRKWVPQPVKQNPSPLYVPPPPAPAIEVFACDTDRIAIRVGDPFVGLWDKVLEKHGEIPCPNCNAAMRYFATSTGYMKTKCPKCGTTVAGEEPDRTEHAPHTPDKPGVVQ